MQVEKGADGKLLVTHKTGAIVFDYVVVSSTEWATQMSLQFVGFDKWSELPQAKFAAQTIRHNISSCKVFFPMTERYWEIKDNKIPQMLVTDSYIHDMYGLTWSSRPEDNGVLLASYTWEDDSLKLLPFDEQELSDLVVAKLKEITESTVGQDITKYIDKSKPVTIQWINEPTYVGCAKLYRARNEEYNMGDLAYNQKFGMASCLYFAGESYSVEGGWTEPALRSALDCVLQLPNHVNAKFNARNFDFDRDYPKWPVPRHLWAKR